MLGAVGLMGDGNEIDDIAAVTKRARVFTATPAGGPASSTPSSARDDWFVAPAGIDDIFDPDAEELWQRVLARKGGHYAVVARMPIDPSVN